MALRRLVRDLRLVSSKCRLDLSRILNRQCPMIQSSRVAVINEDLIGRAYSTNRSQLDHSLLIQFQNKNLLIGPRVLNVEQRRYKKRRSTKKVDDDEDEDEDDDDDDLSAENPLLVDDILGQQSDGSQTMDLAISSLRLDNVAKSAFGVTRQRVEEAFYKGDLYINGRRPSKKSENLYEGDEIDLVKGVNEEDSMLVDIKRCLIVKLPDKASEHGRLKIGVKVWHTMQIPNPVNQQKDED